MAHSHPAPGVLPWEELKREPPAWFRDAKFGMFFHWGPYCVPACENEWYSRNMYARGLPQNLSHEKTWGSLRDAGYKEFYTKGFKGEKFDPGAWAELVRRAGARYAGPVTEHADNFSLWDSAVNPVNSVNYGPHKDVTGLCARAFRERDIRVLATFHHQWLWGWFMSTDPEADVYDPANEVFYGEALPLETNRYIPYRKPNRRFNAQWLAKVEEVVTKYHPDLVYFDSRACIIDEETRFRAAACILRGSDDTAFTYKQEDFPDGVGVRDVERGRFAGAPPFPWQIDDRLEDRVTWCIVEEPRYRSAAAVIAELCDVVAKNGNLLLNVGPRADGSFPSEAVRELEALGDWLRVNGEAIYGTRPFAVSGEGPGEVSGESYDTEKLKRQLREGAEAEAPGSGGAFTREDFRFTQKNGAVYALCFGRPCRIKTFREGGAARRIDAVTLLGRDQPLTFRRTREALEVDLPPDGEGAFALKIAGVF